MSENHMHSKKHIIAFQFYDRDSYSGGPAINAVRILSEFHKQGHEVHALVPYYVDYPNAKELIKAGVCCHTVPKQKYTIDEVKWYSKKLEEIQPDIFVPNISAAAGFLTPYLTKSGIATVMTHRGDDPLNWGHALYFSSDTDYKCSAIVCVSSYLQQGVISKNGQDNIVKVIPSGVPLSNFKADLTKGTSSLVYAGRLEEKPKRISLMFEMFKYAKETNTELKLTLVGGSTESIKKYMGIARDMHIEKEIKFKGPLYGDEYKKELSQHHCILLFSEHEGMPGSIMDGMSCGLIPIVTPLKGIEDLIDNEFNGYIINANKEALSNVISTLNSNLLQPIELSNNAIQTIEKDFSTSSSVNSWLSLFDSITHNLDKVVYSFPSNFLLPKPHKFLLQYTPTPTFIQRIRDKLQLRTKIRLYFNKLVS
jgi:glycosyltransferase involved in cell wall biosynthesis